MVDRVLRLHVEDNGKGFDVEEVLSRKDCFGLAGIRERVAVLGGSVSITSTRKEGQYARIREKKAELLLRYDCLFLKKNSRKFIVRCSTMTRIRIRHRAY